MERLSDKYYDNKELEEMAKANNISKQFYDEFIDRIELEINIMTNDSELVEDEISKAAIDFSVKFIKDMENELSKGHGKEWAKLFAEKSRNEFEDGYLCPSLQFCIFRYYIIILVIVTKLNILKI